MSQGPQAPWPHQKRDDCKLQQRDFRYSFIVSFLPRDSFHSGTGQWRGIYPSCPGYQRGSMAWSLKRSPRWGSLSPLGQDCCVHAVRRPPKWPSTWSERERILAYPLLGTTTGTGREISISTTMVWSCSEEGGALLHSRRRRSNKKTSSADAQSLPRSIKDTMVELAKHSMHCILASKW